MKYPFLKGMATVGIVVMLCGSGCHDEVDEKDREAQNATLLQIQAKVPLPTIVNGSARQIMKQVYEGEDQLIPTFTYHLNTFKSCYMPFHGDPHTFGYPVPGATQMTNPQKASQQQYSMPQADPDGLFKPSSENATYILRFDSRINKTAPQYSEPDVVTFTEAVPDAWVCKPNQ